MDIHYGTIDRAPASRDSLLMLIADSEFPSVEKRRIGLRIPECKTGVLPLALQPHVPVYPGCFRLSECLYLTVVENVVFETTASGMPYRRSDQLS